MKDASTVMLALVSKKTEAVELKNPLMSYVRATYSDREAEEAADDLSSIQQLRQEMAGAVNAGAGNPTVRETLTK